MLGGGKTPGPYIYLQDPTLQKNTARSVFWRTPHAPFSLGTITKTPQQTVSTHSSSVLHAI